MVDLSIALGLGIFISALAVAVAGYIVDMYERIDLSLPFGPAIPYAVAVIGGGIFFLAESGIIGLMKALAGVTFSAAMVKATQKLNTDS